MSICTGGESQLCHRVHRFTDRFCASWHTLGTAGVGLTARSEAKITADIAATQSADTQTAADGKAAIRTKLGQGVTDTDTDTDIATIAAKVAAIRTAETSLTKPITVAADARAVAVATKAATGAPVFSRVKDLAISPSGSSPALWSSSTPRTTHCSTPAASLPARGARHCRPQCLDRCVRVRP
jgi:hypothetical protein